MLSISATTCELILGSTCKGGSCNTAPYPQVRPGLGMVLRPFGCARKPHASTRRLTNMYLFQWAKLEQQILEAKCEPGLRVL